MKNTLWSAAAATAAAAILAGCTSPAARQAAAPMAPAPLPPVFAEQQQQAGLRHIIFVVGDGMGFNTLTAARTYAVGEAGDLTLDTLPEAAYVKTWSNDMQVTDTAAAMSAYMTGVKANNGQLSVTGCGAGAAPRLHSTLLEMARKRGWSAGLVNAGSVTDPLVAAGYAHLCSAADGDAAAAALAPGGAGYNEALVGGLDVVLGGGAQHFGKRADGRDLLAELRGKGYTQVTDAASMLALQPKPRQRVVGVFSAGKQPTLPQMTASAIDVLAGQGNGFFLLVANSHIGQAQRSSTARRALDETVALDAALKTAIAKMETIDPGLKQTLIIMTASSDSTLVLNGYSIRTGKTTATEPGVLGLVRKYSDGTYYKDQDDMPYTIIGYGNGTHRVQGNRAGGPPLSDALVTQPDYRQEAAVRMAPGATTFGGTDVFLGATGARAADFRGTLENTQVHTMIKTAAGW